MEPFAAYEIANRIYSSNIGYIATATMDDDASTKCVMRPARKGEGGKLHESHPEIKILCDLNHRMGSMDDVVFKLAKANMDVSYLKNIEAVRFKRGIQYAIRKNLHKSFEEFCHAICWVL